MKLYDSGGGDDGNRHTCCALSDAEDAKSVAYRLKKDPIKNPKGFAAATGSGQALRVFLIFSLLTAFFTLKWAQVRLKS